MEPRDGNRPGDAPKKKRAPNARKRAPKAVTAAEQSDGSATEREVAPQTAVEPARDQSAVADRSAADGRTTPTNAPDQQTDHRDDGDERQFGERDSDRAADVAADLKSWLDTRREDRDAPREVL